MKKYIALSSFVMMSLLSCKKDDPKPTNPTPQTQSSGFMINFDNKVGNDELVLETGRYKNELGQEYSVDILKYYATNFEFLKEDGNWVKIPNSYFLVDEASKSTQTINLNNVDPGKYSKMRFMVGVDEPRNTSGAQDGALDPIHGMFWTWSTGYIMAKMEGTAYLNGGNKNLSFHIAGFEGMNATQKIIELDIPKEVNIAHGGTGVIDIKADLAEWFKSPFATDFNTLNSIGSVGQDARNMARNYEDMFTVTGGGTIVE